MPRRCPLGSQSLQGQPRRPGRRIVRRRQICSRLHRIRPHLLDYRHPHRVISMNQDTTTKDSSRRSTYRERLSPLWMTPVTVGSGTPESMAAVFAWHAWLPGAKAGFTGTGCLSRTGDRMRLGSTKSGELSRVAYRDRAVTNQRPSPPDSSQSHQLWRDITVETTKGMLRWIFRPQGRVSHNVLRPFISVLPLGIYFHRTSICIASGRFTLFFF